MYKSKCCNADAKWVISPDFLGDDPKKMRVGTCSFKCEKCGEPCDVKIDPALTATERQGEAWTLTITRLDNGYLLCGKPEGQEWVIEDSESDVLKSHESLLWEIMNYFNFGGSKHDKERLTIKRQERGR